MINLFCSFIINYKAVYKPSSTENYVQFETNREDDEIFFTDWQYRQNRPMYGRYREAPSSSSRFSSRPVQHTKKCFICGKVSYWSTNHTQQKRDDLKKKFSDHYLEYRARPSYERILQGWIIDYERIENDDERIAQYFGDLLIDTENDNIPEPESFYIESKLFHTSID